MIQHSSNPICSDLSHYELSSEQEQVTFAKGLPTQWGISKRYIATGWHPTPHAACFEQLL